MKSYSTEFITPQDINSPIPSGAGFGIRFLARFIDTLFGLFIGLLSGLFGGILLAILSQLGRVPENWPELAGRQSFGTYALGFLGATLYHMIGEGMGGITVGKLICGLNVVQIDGRPCSVIGAIKRSLGFYMDALFFGLIGYESMKKTSLRQRYGDHWGKTVVVKKTLYAASPKLPIWRLVVGILLGGGIWMSAQIAGLFVAIG